jgi:16S rRNA (adenine1518-N6/adenine1519-N6)-dimethyltransferase
VTWTRTHSGLPPPRKRFGQHFLEPAWVAKIVASLNAAPTDRFIEIGPGRGALTRPLAALVSELVAVEIDRDLAAHLSTALGGRITNTVRVVTADVLTLDLASLIAREHLPARVVGNIPYNISAPILFSLFAASAGGAVLRDATVMLQKEVADRLLAEPGTSEYGVLTVYAALHARTTRLLTLPPGAFRPPPKVTSTVVRLQFTPAPVDVGAPGVFDALVRGAFAHRRKTLPNALRSAVETLGKDPAILIAAAGLDPRRRPGDLSLADFAALARAVL